MDGVITSTQTPEEGAKMIIISGMEEKVLDLRE
jgi:hypothetical protein